MRAPKDSHPAPIRHPYGTLPPDGTHRRTLHAGPVWRSASGWYTRGIGIRGARGTRCPYGGLPPEGMESCLQTMRMRHRSPAWRESSRRSAPAARVLLVLLGINNIRKQRGYRCRFVVSSVGASTCNYRGVMRFFRGAHDPSYL